MYRVCYRNVTVNEIGEFILKTKFIGLEGFNEIESLSTVKSSSHSGKLNTAQKTIRFIKRAAILSAKTFRNKANRVFAGHNAKKSSSPQMSVIDRRYNADRKGAKSEFSCSAREAVAGFSLKSSKIYAHSAPTAANRAHTIIKKKAVLAVVACMSAIFLSCATVASALDYPTDVKSSPKPTEAADATLNTESTLPENSLDFGSATTDEALETINENAYLLIDSNSTVSGLYIDGELIGATDDGEALKNVLEQILVDYRKDYDEQTTTEFANNVEVKPGNFPKNTLVSADELIAKADGKLKIALSTDIVYTREVNYETKTEYDESEYSSYEKVKTEGEKGEELVTVRTTFIDGVQTDAVETGTKTIKKATDEVIIKGSKDGETSLSYDSSSSGTFCWPMPYTHNLTSTFGYRWGSQHGGLDISAGGIYGQPIIAAASGTVTFAGYDDSGYGYYVTIDHGSGYSTLYGHCSSLAVSSGQQVSQGDVIGYVGSTGYSTGPHLHFEIRVDGVQTDPLGYVS